MSLDPMLHLAARPTEESAEREAPDPHAHVHIPVLGVAEVQDERGVRFLTPNDCGIKAQEKLRGQLFLSCAARNLQAIGVPLEWHQSRKGEWS